MTFQSRCQLDVHPRLTGARRSSSPICAAEDADTTNGTRTFTFTAPGATSASAIVTEQDNDQANQSLIVAPTTVAVPEGLTAGFNVRLNTQPAANVT